MAVQVERQAHWLLEKKRRRNAQAPHTLRYKSALIFLLTVVPPPSSVSIVLDRHNLGKEAEVALVLGWSGVIAQGWRRVVGEGELQSP